MNLAVACDKSPLCLGLAGMAGSFFQHLREVQQMGDVAGSGFPVKYRHLMMAILHDKIRIAKAVNVTVLKLE